MRCPKCGAFMEDTRDVCFMCGTNVKTYNPAMQNYNQQQANAFPTNGDYSQIYNSVKKEDSDIFDFFSDHKGLVSFLGFLLVLGVLFISGLIYYKAKTKEVVLKPEFGQLYYKAEPELFTAGATPGYYTYGAIGSEKGSSCSVSVVAVENTSTNAVYDVRKNLKKSLEPERDSKVEVLDPLKIYTLSEGEVVINNTSWSYFNVFYPQKAYNTATLLKKRVLVVVYNGFAYSVTFDNTNNDTKCAAALDSFERTLMFIKDSEFKEK